MSALSLSIRTATATAAALSCTACFFSSPVLQETRELEIPIADGGRFEIDAGAGSLTLQGEGSTGIIHVQAAIYQVTANDDYTLTLEVEDGKRSRLVAKGGGSRLGGGSERIDLIVTVPEQIDLSVHDGSGSLRIDSIVGNLRIDDGSGSIRIADIDGDVAIEDGSGSISISQVTGDVSINDGSGSITAREVGGKVAIKDGSGSIEVDGAADFELIEDGSGSVSALNISSRGADVD